MSDAYGTQNWKFEEFQSRHLIGWILQNFQETCVESFNILLGNKNAMAPNSLMEEQSRHVYNCDNECSGSARLDLEH